MKEYIEREAALKEFEKVCNVCMALVNKPMCGDCSVADTIRKVKSIPAADVRPVVMCRDCVNYVESDEANGEKMCVIDAEWCEEDGCYYGFNSYTEPDWFCAGGEKREEN